MHLSLCPWDGLYFNRLGFHSEQLNAPPDRWCFSGRLAAPARTASCWGRSVVSAAGKSPAQGVYLSCMHTHTHRTCLLKVLAERRRKAAKTYLTGTGGRCHSFRPSQPSCYSWSHGNWPPLFTQAFTGAAEIRTKPKAEGALESPSALQDITGTSPAGPVLTWSIFSNMMLEFPQQ